MQPRKKKKPYKMLSTLKKKPTLNLKALHPGQENSDLRRCHKIPELYLTVYNLAAKPSDILYGIPARHLCLCMAVVLLVQHYWVGFASLPLPFS